MPAVLGVLPEVRNPRCTHTALSHGPGDPAAGLTELPLSHSSSLHRPVRLFPLFLGLNTGVEGFEYAWVGGIAGWVQICSGPHGSDQRGVTSTTGHAHRSARLLRTELKEAFLSSRQIGCSAQADRMDLPRPVGGYGLPLMLVR